MKGYIESGTAYLELDLDELDTLVGAVDGQIRMHSSAVAALEGEAVDREERARDEPRARAANRRVAGNLRRRAALHRKLMARASDMARVLHGLMGGLQLDAPPDGT